MVPTRRELIVRSLELYPTSWIMAKQWAKKSYTLYSSGKHILQPGKVTKKQTLAGKPDCLNP